jgi:hypothetical protein
MAAFFMAAFFMAAFTNNSAVAARLENPQILMGQGLEDFPRNFLEIS